jgi:hypothetical protein
LSIILLPAVNFNMAQADGRLPSAARGPVQPVSEMLAKSEAAGVMFKSHVLFAVSTPPMLELSLGKPMLFRMTWAFAPDRVMVPVTLPEESKLLANKLY